MIYNPYSFLFSIPVLQICRRWLLLLLGLCLGSCADNDFFQKDALATAAELEGRSPAGKDSVWVVAGRHYDRGGFHRLFWGDHNREVWTMPVKVPVFHLDSLHGGFTVLEKGGGFQTTSFTLQDTLGRHYALRSIDKDPLNVLTPFWRNTFVANIVRDQTSASNPFGVLAVPVLAEAAGVYHSSSDIFYISSSDKSFGQYAPAVQGKLFLLQEKFESPANLTPAFGNATHFSDSEDALQNRFRNNYHHFNQAAFARARLLDLLLGDWDRHKGQWEWAVEKKGTDTIYHPIPKDRDQVFLKMGDGLIPAVATSKFFVRKFHSFEDGIDDVKAYMINSEFMDARLLHELPLPQWIQIATELQAALTDEVIEKAIHQIPAPIYKQLGKQIIHDLKRRRDQLPDIATKMYRILAKEVTIPGTDAAEHFYVKRLDDGQTEVSMYRETQTGTQGKQLYHRIFNLDETQQITLHGLAGDDTFILKGNVQDGIMVKVYGGLGEDTIADSSSVEGLKKMTRIYDTDRGNELYFGSEAKDMTTEDVRVHAYDREGN